MTEREKEHEKRFKADQEKIKKIEKAKKDDLEVIEAQKMKKQEKLRAAVVNREHNLKQRELDLRK